MGQGGVTEDEHAILQKEACSGCKKRLDSGGLAQLGLNRQHIRGGDVLDQRGVVSSTQPIVEVLIFLFADVTQSLYILLHLSHWGHHVMPFSLLFVLVSSRVTVPVRFRMTIRPFPLSSHGLRFVRA